MRNQDVVALTGLPKATASRLMHTLTAMGYLRRIDRGSYVLGEASARSGRAMLDGLRLQRYEPYFYGLLGEPSDFASLEALIAGNMVPVFRWSSECSTLLANGRCGNTTSIGELTRICFDFFFGDCVTATNPANEEAVRQLSIVNWCHQWDESMGQLVACTGVRHKSVGCFVLSLCMPQLDIPPVERIANMGTQLLRAAGAISSEYLDLNGDDNDDAFA